MARLIPRNAGSGPVEAHAEIPPEAGFESVPGSQLSTRPVLKRTGLFFAMPHKACILRRKDISSEKEILTRFSCYTIFVNMKNVTITLDEETARWARIYAAEHDTSVSRMVGEMLRERMHMEEDYRSAMHYYLSEPPRKLKRSGKRYPGREELYDR